MVGMGSGKKKLKICLFSAISPISKGSESGFKTNHEILSKEFRDMGHEVTVLGLASNCSKETIVKRDGIVYWSFPDHNCSLIKRHFLVFKLIKPLNKLIKGGCQIVQAQGGFAFPLVFVKNCIRVATIHGSEPFFNTKVFEKCIRIFLGGVIYRRLDGLIFISELTAKLSRRYYKTKTVPQITQKSPAFLQINVRKRFFQNSIPTIVAASRLEKVKNLENLIKAVEEINKNEQKVKLEIYGDGSLKNKLDKKYLHGHIAQKDMWTKVAKADIFILPSRTEICPNALFETMQIGIVPIVRNLPTLKMIHDGVNGYKIEGNSPENIRRAIEKALKNRNEWKIIAKNAQRTVGQMPRASKQMEAFYHRLRRLNGFSD